MYAYITVFAVLMANALLRSYYHKFRTKWRAARTVTASFHWRSVITIVVVPLIEENSFYDSLRLELIILASNTLCIV